MTLRVSGLGGTVQATEAIGKEHRCEVQQCEGRFSPARPPKPKLAAVIFVAFSSRAVKPRTFCVPFFFSEAGERPTQACRRL